MRRVRQSWWPVLLAGQSAAACCRPGVPRAPRAATLGPGAGEGCPTPFQSLSFTIDGAHRYTGGKDVGHPGVVLSEQRRQHTRATAAPPQGGTEPVLPALP